MGIFELLRLWRSYCYHSFAISTGFGWKVVRVTKSMCSPFPWEILGAPLTLLSFAPIPLPFPYLPMSSLSLPLLPCPFTSGFVLPASGFLPLPLCLPPVLPLPPLGVQRAGFQSLIGFRIRRPKIIPLTMGHQSSPPRGLRLHSRRFATAYLESGLVGSSFLNLPRSKQGKIHSANSCKPASKSVSPPLSIFPLPSLFWFQPPSVDPCSPLVVTCLGRPSLNLPSKP